MCTYILQKTTEQFLDYTYTQTLSSTAVVDNDDERSELFIQRGLKGQYFT